MPELLVLRGIPASGKSTFAHGWVAEDRENRVRVNRDSIRSMLFSRPDWSQPFDNCEALITKVEHSTIRAALESGKSVVVDDTNLVSRFVRQLYKIAPAGTDILVRDFPITREEAYKRDAQRDHPVGHGVIDRYIEKFAPGGVPRPAPTEDERITFDSYEPDEKLPDAIIVDIDGTLAYMRERGPYDLELVHTDGCHDHIRELVHLYQNKGYKIIVVSGRDSSSWTVTENWLFENDIRPDALFMREEGDKRNDAVVKHEILFRYIAPYWNVRLTLDDRDRVVKMWREVGIPCLQVAEGNF